MGDGLVFGLISSSVWVFFFLFRFFLAVCIMECRSREWHSRKLYYLDVTYLNINKAFPYLKKMLFLLLLPIIYEYNIITLATMSQ
jgi:hypothetical protein